MAKLECSFHTVQIQILNFWVSLLFFLIILISAQEESTVGCVLSKVREGKKTNYLFALIPRL